MMIDQDGKRQILESQDYYVLINTESVYFRTASLWLPKDKVSLAQARRLIYKITNCNKDSSIELDSMREFELLKTVLYKTDNRYYIRPELIEKKNPNQAAGITKYLTSFSDVCYFPNLPLSRFDKH